MYSSLFLYVILLKKYGLIGKKLSHSFSKKYFTEKFENQGIEACYLNFELNEISDFSDLLTKDLSGLNVTIPYKETIIPFLDELSPEAQEVSAVNTIQFSDGKLIGHNTDIFGFQQMIKPFLASHHERALILGTGGASKAVAYVLENLGIDVVFVSRSKKANNIFGYVDINQQMCRSIKLIVNTTPVGMFPDVNVCPQFPFEFLTADHLVIDLIYNPEKTQFLAQSELQGALIVNGKTMLEQQAERAWQIWNE